MADWTISDEEFNKQYDEATAKTEEGFLNRPKIKSLFYNDDFKLIEIY